MKGMDKCVRRDRLSVLFKELSPEGKFPVAVLRLASCYNRLIVNCLINGWSIFHLPVSYFRKFYRKFLDREIILPFDTTEEDCVWSIY